MDLSASPIDEIKQNINIDLRTSIGDIRQFKNLLEHFLDR